MRSILFWWAYYWIFRMVRCGRLTRRIIRLTRVSLVLKYKYDLKIQNWQWFHTNTKRTHIHISCKQSHQPNLQQAMDSFTSLNFELGASVATVNTYYEGGSDIPKNEEEPGKTTNCYQCTIAWVLNEVLAILSPDVMARYRSSYISLINSSFLQHPLQDSDSIMAPPAINSVDQKLNEIVSPHRLLLSNTYLSPFH